MRNGSIVEGDIADARADDSTVRIASLSKLMPGAFGLQPVDYTYLDVRNEFVFPRCQNCRQRQNLPVLFQT